MSNKHKEPPLSFGDENFRCEQDLFDAALHRGGHVHFGTAMNRAVMELVVQHLPPFLGTRDTVYQMPHGNLQFRALVARELAAGNTASETQTQTETLTQFDAEHVVTMNSVYAVLSVLALHHHQQHHQHVHEHVVAVTGANVEALSFVATHSSSDGLWKTVSLHSASELVGQRIHFVMVIGALEETSTSGVNLADAIDHFQWLKEQYANDGAQVLTVFVLESATQLSFFQEVGTAPIVFAFAHSVCAGTIQCGVAVTAHEATLKILRADAFFAPLSSAVQAAALNGEILQQGSFTDLAETISKMIGITENIQGIDPANIIFGTGGSAVIDALGRILFNRGDKLALDAPYYSGFVGDFTRSGIVLHFVEYFDEDEVVTFDSLTKSKHIKRQAFDNRPVKNTLKLRAQRAYEDGCCGFVVCNPHNPTGRLYAPHEIHDLCEWAIALNNQALVTGESGVFHLIFDELYSHSIYDHYRSFVSAIPYSQISWFIHVIRGFAKDFGLCGFKTGYGFSSNRKVLALTQTWRKIMRPQAVNAQILNELLLKTEFGQLIYSRNEELLSSAIKRITTALDAAKISYVIPHAGVFIMINLSNELRVNVTENEYTLWKNLLHSKKLNITPGKIFGYREQGWYRLCPFTPVGMIDEGFERLATFVEEELR